MFKLKGQTQNHPIQSNINLGIREATLIHITLAEFKNNVYTYKSACGIVWFPMCSTLVCHYFNS